jgi:hypothetical protein
MQDRSTWKVPVDTRWSSPEVTEPASLTPGVSAAGRSVSMRPFRVRPSGLTCTASKRPPGKPEVEKGAPPPPDRAFIDSMRS